MKHKITILFCALFIFAIGLGGLLWGYHERNLSRAVNEAFAEKLRVNSHLDGMRYQIGSTDWIYLKSDDLIRMENRFVSEDGNQVTEYIFKTFDGHIYWANSFTGYRGLLEDCEDLSFYNINYFVDWLASRVENDQGEISIGENQYTYKDEKYFVTCHFNATDSLYAYAIWRLSDKHGEPFISIELHDLALEWQPTHLFEVPIRLLMSH